MNTAMRRRFPELARLSISVRLGSYRADILYWGWLGEKWWRNYLHTHSFFEICYAHDGVGTFEMEGVKHKVRKGDLFIAKPNEAHEIISDRKKPLGIYFWAFALVPDNRAAKSPAAESIDAMLRSFMTAKRCISRSTGMAVERTCELLTHEIMQPRPGYTAAIESLVTKLLLDTTRATVDSTAVERIESPDDDGAAAIAATIQGYLRDNLGRPIGVRDLAAQVRLSQRHVNRIFKNVTGQSVGQYLIDLRIAAAGQLLRSKTMPIKEIARTVGYPDARYFTTLFGQRTGMTPAQFREKGGTRYLRRRK